VKERLGKLLEELSLLDGLPGHEQSVIRYLKEQLSPFADELSVGVNGNIYARKTGKKPGLTVMVAAHIDERCLSI
jgi:putative aminopeptidase FrvX